MQFDAIIAGGQYFDGSGSPSRRCNVGIREGRIAAVTESELSSEGCPLVVDASNRWVLPGFIEPHSHYDAEIIGAPELSESVRHGVTTVFTGICSLSAVLAEPEDCSDIFTRVEGVPRDRVLPASSTDEVLEHARRLRGVSRVTPARPQRCRLLGPFRPESFRDGTRAIGLGRPAVRGRARADGVALAPGPRGGVSRTLDHDHPARSGRRRPSMGAASALHLRLLARASAPSPHPSRARFRAAECSGCDREDQHRDVPCRGSRLVSVAASNDPADGPGPEVEPILAAHDPLDRLARQPCPRRRLAMADAAGAPDPRDPRRGLLQLQ